MSFSKGCIQPKKVTQAIQYPSMPSFFLKICLAPKKEQNLSLLISFIYKRTWKKKNTFHPKIPPNFPDLQPQPSPGVVECHEWRLAVDLSKHQNLDLQAMPGFATASPRNLGGPVMGGWSPPVNRSVRWLNHPPFISQTKAIWKGKKKPT